MIIAKAEEKGQDQELVKKLCKKMNFESKPIGTLRVGHKSTDSQKERLLKVTFANSFDARSILP